MAVAEMDPYLFSGEDLYVPDHIDDSFINTIRSGGILATKAAMLAIGVDFDNGPDAYEPQRYVELDPSSTHFLTTEFGTVHRTDIYNQEFLGEDNSILSPLVITASLSLPSEKGFNSPITAALVEYCRLQGRAVIVVGSEGFGGVGLSPKQLKDLDFDTIAHNVHDVLDQVEEVTGFRIPNIITTGASRGGTLSFLLAASDILKTRDLKGKPERVVDTAIPIAPAGLKKMSVFEKYLAIRQFSVSELAHVVRKSSGMADGELKDYIKTLYESKFPPTAAPAVLATTLLFLNGVPLENIGKRLDPQTRYRLLTMDFDGVTKPNHWKGELADLPDVITRITAGHHATIDSIRIGFQFTRRWLDEDVDEFDNR